MPSTASVQCKELLEKGCPTYCLLISRRLQRNYSVTVYGKLRALWIQSGKNFAENTKSLLSENDQCNSTPSLTKKNLLQEYLGVTSLQPERVDKCARWSWNFVVRRKTRNNPLVQFIMWQKEDTLTDASPAMSRQMIQSGGVARTAGHTVTLIPQIDTLSAEAAEATSD